MTIFEAALHIANTGEVTLFAPAVLLTPATSRQISQAVSEHSRERKTTLLLYIPFQPSYVQLLHNGHSSVWITPSPRVLCPSSVSSNTFACPLSNPVNK
jgi:hypothetical protein